MRPMHLPSVNIVLELWDTARFEGPNFYATFGKVTLKRLFDIHPEAQQVFGIDQGPAVFKSKVTAHEKAIVLLFDSVFQMVLQQPDFMEQVLQQVGVRHGQVGAHPRLFPYMGEAIQYALETYFLPQPFTEEEHQAWEHVYSGISDEITRHIDLDIIEESSEETETREECGPRDMCSSASNDGPCIRNQPNETSTSSQTQATRMLPSSDSPPRETNQQSSVNDITTAMAAARIIENAA
eukprot:CAMPEP_0172466934 /NCGR_PEP_ID=MMETSP1065-20121228/57489_1 /TAXON_ID=265537 /ORGANISM="Amphiprora paludosa, Strain CCMP125" /LENGTH=237 /DNA_ID=CAMNT_0013223907 /DNA_START=507 /DNA_END=1220 /DNA_ORIENTATION=-